MKKLTIIMTLLLAAFTAQAQEASMPPSAQAQKKVIRWMSKELPKTCCRDYLANNELVTVYDDDNINFILRLYVSLDKKYVILHTVFLNKSFIPFTIYPDKFTMRLTEPQNKTYNSVSAEEVAKVMENRGRWRRILAAGLAGAATTETTGIVSDNQGNTATVTITEPDKQAVRNAQNSAQKQIANNQNRASVIREFQLPAHTLFKDKIIEGLVFFKKEKLTDGMIISFEIDGITYEIPYGEERTKLNQQK